MDQKIFNNIILLIIIAFIIKQVSPEPDSILYILKKYINYFVYQFKKILARFNLTTIENFEIINKIFDGTTFKGMPVFANNTPSFKSPYEVAFVNFYKNKYPNVVEKEIYTIYHFLQTLINIDTDQYFLTPSDQTPNSFNDDELEKIKNILLKKLNHSNFNFSNFNFEYYPKYYLNSSGKEVDPFVFKIDSPIGNLRIYINIDIRNDVYQNKEYLVVNEIKPLKDKQVIFTNQNSSQDSSQYSNQDSSINYNQDSSINYNQDSSQYSNQDSSINYNQDSSINYNQDSSQRKSYEMYAGNDYFFTNTHVLNENGYNNIQDDYISNNKINNNIMYEFPHVEEPLLFSQIASNDPEFINYS